MSDELSSWFEVGRRMTEVGQRADEMVGDLDRMRQQLRSKVAGGIFQEALAIAAAEVTAEIVQELESGDPAARRLSDPRNVDGRNKAFAEKAAIQVRRLSEGGVVMTKADIDAVRQKRTIK